ncbi:MAG TPA: 2-keto-4-pentenoate hydratase, partial [Stellaceae bacterium]|nr:2-keto-4-pentenoate hydratase [Stellaceae bacterium]
MTLGERLVAARRSGVPIPAEMLQSEADAYAVQEAVIRALPARIGGWKVGASSPEAEPSTAPLFADLIAESPPRGTLGGVEAELAFRVERALPARARPYDEAEAWAAMGSMHPAIEILDSR